MRELLEKVKAMPRRVEPIGGQNFSYVQLGELIGWIESRIEKTEIEPVGEVLYNDGTGFNVEWDALAIYKLKVSTRLYAYPPDTALRLSEALTAANQFRAERDELQARIDGGIRVYAYKTIFGEKFSIGIGKSNATLILDEG